MAPLLTAAIAIRYLARNKSLDIPMTFGERIAEFRNRLLARLTGRGSVGSGAP